MDSINTYRKSTHFGHGPLDWETYTSRKLGPKYPEHDTKAPVVDRNYLPGLIIGITMAHGPLAAYAVGFGL